MRGRPQADTGNALSIVYRNLWFGQIQTRKTGGRLYGDMFTYKVSEYSLASELAESKPFSQQKMH